MVDYVLVADDEELFRSKVRDALVAAAAGRDGVEVVETTLHELRQDVRERSTTVMTRTGDVRWDEIEVVVIDGFDAHARRREATDMPFAGLEIALRLQRDPGPWRREVEWGPTDEPPVPPRIVGYSAEARDARVRVPWNEVPVQACVLYNDLIDPDSGVAIAVIEGQRVVPRSQPNAAPGDYVELDLQPSALDTEGSRISDVLWWLLNDAREPREHAGTLWPHLVIGPDAIPGDEKSRKLAANSNQKHYNATKVNLPGWRGVKYNELRKIIKRIAGFE